LLVALVAQVLLFAAARYKICEFHLKARHVVKDGQKLRFCQQCGRFHDVNEFDGDKRSCRARLLRHNARRRKKGDVEKSGSLSRKSSVRKSASRETLPRAGSEEQRPVNRQRTSQASSSTAVKAEPAPAADWGRGANVTAMPLDTALSELLQDDMSGGSERRDQGGPVTVAALQDFLDNKRCGDYPAALGTRARGRGATGRGRAVLWLGFWM
jgi:SBP domain